LNQAIAASASDLMGPEPSLRGVGSSNISASFDSAVAFDFDGVQVSTMRMVQAGFFDVEQIDVLKGPQSLFFGKSASAGVLSLRSANPTKKWEVAGKASYEFEEDAYLVGGHISGPLSDTLGIRVAAQYSDAKKFVTIQPGIAAVNRDRGLRDFVGRLTLQWEPVDNFKANFKFNYVTNRNDGAVAQTDTNCGPNGRADEIVLLGGAVAIPSGANCNDHDNYYAISDPSPTQTVKFPSGSGAEGIYPGHPFGKTDIIMTRLRWDLDLMPHLTLTSVSGFLNLKAVDFDSYSYVGVGPAFNPNGISLALIAPALAANNAPGSAMGVGSSDPVNKTRQFTQELRLASDFDSKLNFMLGAFYEWREIDFNTSQMAVNFSIIRPDVPTGVSYDWFKKHKTKTDTVSIFGSAKLDLTDRLELAGGLRWTKENKVNTISVPYVNAALAAGPAFIDPGFFSGPIRFHDSNVSPEVSLRYKASDDINLYAAYKTGFKSGGIDNSALPSNSLSAAALSGDFSSLIYKSEIGKGGEVGIKSQFANRTLTLNASAFYYRFTDLQIQVFNAVAVQFVTKNAGQLTTKGFDLEFGWRTPVEGLRLSSSLAYTDATFTKDFFGTTGQNLKGRRVARAPEFAGNVAFDLAVPVGDALQFGMNGNMQWVSSYFTNNDRLTDLKQPSYVTFDGSISIGDPKGAWKLSLVGVNLTNKIYTITSGGRPFLAPPGGYGTPGTATYVPAGDDLAVSQNRGRQVFVEASFKF
jgi:iron complex outermembrane receptor protein